MNRWRRLQKTHKSLSAKLINFAPAADGLSASEIPIATRIRLIGGGELVQITTPPPQSGSMGQRMLRRESNLQSVSRRRCREWKWLALNSLSVPRRLHARHGVRSTLQVLQTAEECLQRQRAAYNVAIQCCTNKCNNFWVIYIFFN